MIIELDIQNCSDKKGLVYALAECGYPVAIKQTVRSRIIPTAHILIVNLEKSKDQIIYTYEKSESTSNTYDIPVQEHEKSKIGICGCCIHKYVCKHYAIMMKYDYGYNHMLVCSHYIKGKEVPGQMMLEDSE